jgi:very-short-patch-repair endonuclease
VSHPLGMLGAMTPDRAIADIAGPQHGIVAGRQATAAGMTRKQIRRRVANGDLDDLGEDVLRFPGAHRTWRQRVSAAALAGAGGVAATRTACALYGVPGFAENRVEVLRTVTDHSTSCLAVVHRTRWLPPWHITVIDGIRVTTMARTLFDLAAVVSFPRLERAVNNALLMRLVTLEQLDAMLQEMAERGRSGIRPMRRILAKLGPGKPPSESELEDEFEALLGAANEPLPKRQVDVGGEHWIGRVDYRDEGTPLLYEVDGRTYHQQQLESAADEVRDAELAAAGFILFRIKRWQLKDRPEWVLKVIRELRRRHSVDRERP